MEKEFKFQTNDICSPTAVKKIDKLTEIERNIYLSIAYLMQKRKFQKHPYTGDDCISSKDIQNLYKEITDEDISTEEVNKIILDLDATEIDFRKSELKNCIGDIELVRSPLWSDGFYIAYTDCFPFNHILLRSSSDKCSNKKGDTWFLYNVASISSRTLLAIFNNDEDVCFWRYLYNENEEGDLSVEEFNQMAIQERFEFMKDD